MLNSESTIAEILQLNVLGVNPKVHKQKIKLQTLREIIRNSDKKIPVLIFSETHWKEYILDAEISIPGYNLLSADRTKRKQGGVAIYSHHTFSIDGSEIYTSTNHYCECAMVYNQENNLVIAAMYKPPDCPPIEFQECLNKVKAFIDKYDGATTLMFGDINLKFIDWNTETIRKPDNITQTISKEERVSSNMFLDFVNENLLVQMVTETTRKNKSILDLLLTSDEDIIFDVNVEKNNLDTDHDTVTRQIRLKSTSETDDEEKSEKKIIDNLNFEKADWEKIRKDLSEIQWSEKLNNFSTVEDMYRYLEDQLTTTCVKHAPERIGRNKKTGIPRNRLQLIRKRKRTNATINLLKYVAPKTAKSAARIEKLNTKKLKIEEEMKLLIKEELMQKEINALKHMRKNPKYFYSYVKKFGKTENRIGPLKDDQGKLNSDPADKANILQDQYIKVFSNPNNTNKNTSYDEKTQEEITDIEITLKDVKDAIKEIPTYAAPGPDKLPAIIFKECVEELAEAIQIIWRKSLDNTDIPKELKLQTIIPLFKKGSKGLAENYRPVSLTSHLIKVFERVFRKKMIKFIEDNMLLSNNQHAFRRGRSCISQLLQHWDEILHSLQNNVNID